MGTTEKLARFITELDYSRIPRKGVEQAKLSITDTLGTALVGNKEDIGAVMRQFVADTGGNPQARLIGSGTRTSVVNAALANGSFGHADDYDDVGGFGHAGVVLVPAALALGEWLKLPGSKIIEGYAVGFEIGNRLRNSIGEVQGEAGFHSSSLLGAVAAAAESSKLMGLDVTQTMTAMGIAASLASGIMQNFGTMTKPLHSGRAASNGVTAAILAKEGLSASLNIMEGPRGFFFVYGQEQADIMRMTQDMGKLLAIAEHGVSIKPWPCCAGNHEALTAIFQLIEENKIKPDLVDSVEVATSWRPPGPLVCSNRPLRTALEGRFSIQYNMATALVDGKIDLYSYTEEKLRRPEIQALMKKVSYVQHPDFADKPLRLQSESRFAVVTLKLKDGRVLSLRKGIKDRKKLVGKEQVFGKYRENAKFGGLKPDDIERSVELLDNLETLDDVTRLMDAVTSG